MNVTGDYLWVFVNNLLMDFEIAYTYGGARVNVWRKTNFWVIMGAFKMDINRWEVVVNGEGHATRSGYTIVTIYLTDNNK